MRYVYNSDLLFTLKFGLFRIAIKKGSTLRNKENLPNNGRFYIVNSEIFDLLNIRNLTVNSIHYSMSSFP